MRKKIFQVAIIALLVFAPALVSAYVKVDGIKFDKTITVMGKQLHLKGAALLRHMVIIKAYAGALYMPEYKAGEQILSPIAKRLDLEYYHAIKREDFAKATRIKIQENLSADEFAVVEPRVEEFSSLYRDVKPGDRYSLAYIPGQGTVLSLNGLSLGVIRGDDFASAVFSIWLGGNPIDKTFRDRLLGI